MPCDFASRSDYGHCCELGCKRTDFRHMKEAPSFQQQRIHELYERVKGGLQSQLKAC